MTRAPIRVFAQLERWLEQVGVQTGSSVEPGQDLRRHQTHQPAMADEPPRDRAVLLLDPSLIVLAVGT